MSSEQGDRDACKGTSVVGEAAKGPDLSQKTELAESEDFGVSESLELDLEEPELEALEDEDDSSAFDPTHQPTAIQFLRHGGMLYFLNIAAGFRGVVKESPEDFVVNEIATDGTVITLTDEEVSNDLAPEVPVHNIDEAEQALSEPTVSGLDGQQNRGRKSESGDGSTGPSSRFQEMGLDTLLPAASVQQLLELESAYLSSKKILDCEESVPVQAEHLRVGVEVPMWQPTQQNKGDGDVDAHLLDSQARGLGEITLEEAKNYRAECHRKIRARWPWMMTNTVGTMLRCKEDQTFYCLRGLLSETEISQVQVFAFASRNLGIDKAAPGIHEEMCVAKGASRETRTSIHQAISRHLPFLQASTDSSRDGPRIRIQRRENKGTRAARKRARKSEGPLGPELMHTAFVLRKIGKEHLQAMTQLARFFSTQPSAFTINGIKDKMGVTTQQVAVRGISPTAVWEARNKFTGMVLGKVNGKQRDAGLAVGDLRGNRFSLRIKRIKGDKESVQQSVQNLKIKGFMNYFGHQRLGKYDRDGLMPHAAGAAMIRGEHKAAVEILLQCHGGGLGKQAAVQAFLRNGDASEALRLLPKGFPVQEIMFKALKRNGNDAFMEALRSLPHGTRSLFPQSYQSYVFNCMATERLRRFGEKVVAGDLVLSGESEQSESKRARTAIQTRQGRVHVVSKAEVEAGKFTMQDVVLPMPGKNTAYPENEIRELYQGKLAEDGIDIEDPTKNMTAFSNSLVGSYRKINEVANNVVFSLANEDGEKNLHISFDLAKGCYATCVLRELMKVAV